jgi:hypothetical protein
MNLIHLPGQPGPILLPDMADLGDMLRENVQFGFLWDVVHTRRLDRMTPEQRKAVDDGIFPLIDYDRRAIISHSVDHNIMPTEGLNYVLNSAVRGLAQLTSWYIGLFEGNYTPVLADTAATFPGSATESTAYAESTRQAYTTVAASGGVLTNAAAVATFTANATKTWYGGFLTSASAKSAITGTLLSAAKFATSKTVDSTDQLLVTATLTATSS